MRWRRWSSRESRPTSRCTRRSATTRPSRKAAPTSTTWSGGSDCVNRLGSVTLSFDLGALDPDVAESACFACGAAAVTFLDAQDDPVLEPLPGEVRLWPTTRVLALFAPDSAVPGIKDQLSASLGISAADIELMQIEDRAWEREWLRDFHAMRFGKRLWVCPWHEQIGDPQAAVVRLDPGLAFG